MAERDEIVAEIKAAFSAKRPREVGPLVDSVQGDEPANVAAAFADKEDWTALDAAWLDLVPDGLGSALSFLSAKAIRFYIPAYMVADLRGALSCAEPSFHLTHGFDIYRDIRVRPRQASTWTDAARERWDALTAEQAAAVVRYLEWCVARNGADVGASAVDALASYWRARAGGAHSSA